MQSDGTTFTENTVYCDASTTLIFTNQYCIVPMTALASSPYSYTVAGTVIQAEVKAKNSKGWSTVSSAYGSATY
jgi:hypothetical protein